MPTSHQPLFPQALAFPLPISPSDRSRAAQGSEGPTPRAESPWVVCSLVSPIGCTSVPFPKCLVATQAPVEEPCRVR